MGKIGGLIIAGTVTAAGLLTVTGVEPASAGGGSTDWKQIDVGGVHSCGITTDGRLFCWGNDANGQLGDGAPFDSMSTPSEVLGPSNWKVVDAGGDHTCAIKTSGLLFCWGDDDNGQLGNGAPATDSNGPLQVGAATDWKRLSLGQNHTCATKTTGRLYCWGDDVLGQLGDGTSGADSLAPGEVFGGATNWKQLAAGQAHVCATKRSGRLFCWGDDTAGALGDGTAGGSRDEPGEVEGAATTWNRVSGGQGHTCATKNRGRLFCWGSDSQGQLGIGAGGGGSPSPLQVNGAATNWKSVSAAQSFTCAQKTNGRVFCWGFDGQGQLGNGAGGSSEIPVQVDGSETNWTKVSAGATHACARKTNRRLFCWGNDTSGQLGDGLVVPGDMSNAPGQVVAHP